MALRTRSVGGRCAVVVALAVLVPVGLAAQAPTQAVIPAVRAAIARQDFADGERLIREYRSNRGVTPEMLEALSWLGRGALAAKQWAKADDYARQTYDLARAALKSRPMDEEPRLPIALGRWLRRGQSRWAPTANRNQNGWFHCCARCETP